MCEQRTHDAIDGAIAAWRRVGRIVVDGNPRALAEFIRTTVRRLVQEAETFTQYRTPLVGFATAEDPRFLELRKVADPGHWLPSDLLPGARSVVSFFLPFAPWVVEANARHREVVAREWVVAYVETNAQLSRIGTHLIEALADMGIHAAAEPPTHNFDPVTLVSHWSHKSVAVIAGLGSFGLHQMVITNAGCAGRFGSLVLDAALPVTAAEPQERCLYYYDGSCLECVQRCPAEALDAIYPFDRQRCYQRLLGVAKMYEELGQADVCGKCAIGPCAFEATTAS